MSGGSGTAKRSPAALAAELAELWSPRVIAEVDDHFVKVARVRGSMPWHDHADEDELFYVLDGALTIEMRDRTVELAAGELFVVPAGVPHRPAAAEDCLIMLFERTSTRHTGNVETGQTRTIEEQLF
jgi:mannose-6-phosphate isomerase-like protein (cupin superfamily)